MEFAKERLFEVKYDTKLDRLVIKKETIISKIRRTIKRHKLITMASIALAVFSFLNFAMIYNFMKILQNI